VKGARETSREVRAVTVQAAADLLSISKRTLHRLIAAGEFPAPVKIGSSSRILVTDLERYIDRIQRRRGT
jgi:excisionase family DNA binding protein